MDIEAKDSFVNDLNKCDIPSQYEKTLIKIELGLIKKPSSNIRKSLQELLDESQKNNEPIYCITDKLLYNKNIPKNISGAVVAVKDKDGVIEYLSENIDFTIDVKTGSLLLSKECSDRNNGKMIVVFFSCKDNPRNDFPYAEESLPRYRKAQYKYSALERLSFDHKLRNKRN